MKTHTTMPAPMRIVYGIAILAGVLIPYLLANFGVLTVLGEPVLSAVVTGAAAVFVALQLRIYLGHRFTYPRQPGVNRTGITYVFIALVALVCAFLAGQTLAMMMYQQIGSTGFDTTVHNRELAGVQLTMLLSIVVAPLSEEFIFRGLVYPLLRRRVSMFMSVVAVTVPFAMLHGNLMQMIAAIPLSIVVTLIYERTRSVWACFLTHMGFNVAALFLSPAVIVALANPLSVAVILVVFSGVTFLLYYQTRSRLH